MSDQSSAAALLEQCNKAVDRATIAVQLGHRDTVECTLADLKGMLAQLRSVLPDVLRS